jgi:hypothetical protein
VANELATFGTLNFVDQCYRNGWKIVSQLAVTNDVAKSGVNPVQSHCLPEHLDEK